MPFPTVFPATAFAIVAQCLKTKVTGQDLPDKPYVCAEAAFDVTGYLTSQGLLLSGQQPVVHVDYTDAAKWFEMAGNTDAAAQAVTSVPDWLKPVLKQLLFDLIDRLLG